MPKKFIGVTRNEALAELHTAIEDIFYTASLFRALNEPETAQRIGDLGDKLQEEYLRVRKGPKVS
jgi:hypothetical protein